MDHSIPSPASGFCFFDALFHFPGGHHFLLSFSKNWSGTEWEVPCLSHTTQEKWFHWSANLPGAWEMMGQFTSSSELNSGLNGCNEIDSPFCQISCGSCTLFMGYPYRFHLICKITLEGISGPLHTHITHPHWAMKMAGTKLLRGCPQFFYAQAFYSFREMERLLSSLYTLVSSIHLCPAHPYLPQYYTIQW